MSFFLRLDDIPGDAKFAPFASWIELVSAQVGPGGVPLSGGVGASGPAANNQLHCTARLGRHSPKLAELVMTGRGNSGELVFAQGTRPVWRIVLKNVNVITYQTSGRGNEPIESFTLLADPFTMTYSK